MQTNTVYQNIRYTRTDNSSIDIDIFYLKVLFSTTIDDKRYQLFEPHF